MSKYKIYRIDQNDPVHYGKRRKRMNIMMGLLSLLFFIIYYILHLAFNVGFDIAYPLTILLVVGVYYYFYRKLKAEDQKILTIGDIEFSKKGIVKHLGDSSTDYNYDSIESIELQKHIPALNVNESKTGYRTYILSILFKDSHKENLIISDRPLGKFQELSITDTLKTLKKIISAEVILK
jgi:hypothetical protein